MARPSGAFDAAAKCRVVLLSEGGKLFDFNQRPSARGDLGHISNRAPKLMANLADLVLGSVALNYGSQFPVSKVHQINGHLILTSLVFRHSTIVVERHANLNSSRPTSPTTSLFNCSFSSSASHWNGSTPNSIDSRPESRQSMSISPTNQMNRTITTKYGLTVLWDLTTDKEAIEQLIRGESHLLNCFLTSLKDDLLTGLRSNSGQLIRDAFRKFVVAVNSAINAYHLAVEVSAELFVGDLLNLVKLTDTKATSFFFSKLLSTILLFAERTRNGDHNQPNLVHRNQDKQIVVTTTSQEKRPLMEKLLIVINYFARGYLVEEVVFESPQLSHNLGSNLARDSCPYNCFFAKCPHQTSVPNLVTSMAQSVDSVVDADIQSTSSSNHNLANSSTSTCSRKSCDESLGYGSLSDSGSSNEMISDDCEQSSVQSNNLHPVRQSTAELLEPFFEQLDALSLLSKDSALNCHSSQSSVSSKSSSSSDDEQRLVNPSRRGSTKPQLEQSKMYIKEYQNLRFHSPPCTGKDGICSLECGLETPSANPVPESSSPSTSRTVSSSDTIVNCSPKSSISISGSTDAKRHSILFDLDLELNCLDDLEEIDENVFESKELPGFIELEMPKVNCKREPHADPFLGPPTRESSSVTGFSPTISDNRLIAHTLVQGVMRRKETGFRQMMANVNCHCDHQTKSIIHVDIDQWSVEVIETTPGERRATGSSPNGTGLATSSAAVMCNQVGGLCENLISLANVEIRPQFILGYLESRLKELRMKSRVLASLVPTMEQLRTNCYPGSPLAVMSMSFDGQFTFPFESGFQSMSSMTVLSLGSEFGSSWSGQNQTRPAGWSGLVKPALGFDSSDIPLLSNILARDLNNDGLGPDSTRGYDRVGSGWDWIADGSRSGSRLGHVRPRTASKRLVDETSV